EAGTMNPVLLLDEVDKLGNDWRGDPSSALLEVLDPAQNHTFRDHYLEVELDLSDVLFIATANVADTIPGPLLDRMEVIRLAGYTEDEKIAIARDHLLGRQVERNGLGDDEVTVADGAMRVVIADYTRQLAAVMKESAAIARAYVRSHGEELGLEPEACAGRRFHLHVPAGAVPKDGPSAGVTMTTALVSLLRGRAVRSAVGMTGEVTLSGRVLPIGGVKQKVLAAHRAGLTDVILPARNRPDLHDVPEAAREAVTFHLADDIGQVLAVALEDASSRAAAA